MGGSLSNATISGALIEANGTTNLSGAIVNNGVLTFLANAINNNSGGFDDNFAIVGPTSLTGTGEVILLEAAESRIFGSGPLTNGASHRLRGTGRIEVTDLTNQGQIRAEGGTLTLLGAINNVGGALHIAADGVLNLGASPVTGGQLIGAAGAVLNGGTLTDLAISNSVRQANSITNLSGVITNTGTLTYFGNAINNNSGGPDDSFTIPTAATLTGLGRLVMVELNESALSGVGTLTNTGGHTIEGTGTISVNVNNTGGIIKLNADSQLNLFNTTITGGEIQTSAQGLLGGSGSTLSGVTITGTLRPDTGTLNLAGTITNNGTLSFRANGLNNNSGGADDNYALNSPVTLAGVGKLHFLEANESRVTGLGTLTNGPNHTISGDGQVAVPLENQGFVEAGQTLLATAGYTQTSTGKFVARQFGLTDWNEFRVTGAAALDGTLIVDYGGIIPVGTTSYDVLFADTITGTFTGVSIVQSKPWIGSATFQIIPNASGATDVVRLTLTNTASGLPGDYNNDGAVDAADYTVYRENLNRTLILPNDPTPGTVVAADYDVWRTNFGLALGSSASSATAVPEPTGLGLLALSLLLGWALPRRRICTNCSASVPWPN